MIPGSTSKSLLERLRSGPDDEAWGRLVFLYTPLIRVWLKRAGLQASDVEEVTQEVMLKLMRELPKFGYNRSRGKFRNWLRAIVRNRLTAFFRRKKAIPIGTGGDDSAVGNLLDQLADPESELSQRFDEDHERVIADRVMKLVEPEVESKTWQAFRLVSIDGKDPAEVAKELAMTVNNVYQVKRRVLRRLREVREELEGLL